MKKISLIVIFLFAAAVTADELAKPGSFWLWDWIVGLVANVITMLFQGIMALIRWNPRVFCLPDEVIHGCEVTGGIDKLMPYFMDILVPLYIIALMFTAMYFLVKGGSPRGRARAKVMLSKLLFSIVIISMSPIIYQTLLDISSALVEYIFSLPFLDMDDLMYTFGLLAASNVGLVCVLIVGILVLTLVAIIVAIRYFFVLIFAVLFPFLLFLYFFDLTRGFGRKWLRRAVAWIFTPVVQTLFLVFTIIAFQDIGSSFTTGFSISGPLVAYLMALTGMIMVGATPLIMGKIYGFVGGGITAYGIASNTPWVSGVGALIEGRGPGAIEQTKGVLSRAIYADMAVKSAQGASQTPGTTAPAAAFKATGGESADKMAERDVDAIKAADSGPVTARKAPLAGGGGAPSAGGGREKVEPAPFSVGATGVYPHEIEMKTLRRGGKGISPLGDEKRLSEKISLKAKKVAQAFSDAGRKGKGALAPVEGMVGAKRDELVIASERLKGEIPRKRAEEVANRERLLREEKKDGASEESDEAADEASKAKREGKRKRREK